MTIISEIEPGLRIKPNVAIVASSGKLLDSSYGTLIDEFDEVVRFNRAPTKGYEAHVGSKTTIRMVNSGVLAGAKLTCGEGEDFLKSQLNISIIGYSPKRELLEKSNSIHASCSRYLINTSNRKDINDKIGYKNKKQPTVGTAFIGLCAYKGIVPHLFGYDLNKNKGKVHYWDNCFCTINQKHHAWFDEKEYVKRLVEQKKVIYYN